ncbi:MAG: hypothetical protein ACD_23C01023G0007 [uncultured bacterium]|nr:MAG: hypothetical protein ACD_23C01023G0007 [uncultured bacterium]
MAGATLEMFARAFDAYITDKIEAQTQNNYLSHTGRIGDIVLRGDERSTINAAFDVLVNELKQRKRIKVLRLFEPSEVFLSAGRVVKESANVQYSLFDNPETKRPEKNSAD